MAPSIQLSEVARDDSDNPEHFNEHYKKHSKPVILTSVTQNWPAREKWTIEYFQQQIGDVEVPVYNSQPATGRSHQHAAAIQIKMRDYLEKLKLGESDLRLFFYNILQGAPQLNKDYAFPKFGFNFFRKLPVMFMGGKNAKVQLHFDIDLANLFLCHFGGKKRVYLFSPEQTKYLYHVPFSFSALHSMDILNPDFDRFPALKKVVGEVATLEHGDTLFIPSGYWHYIVYEDIGFSLTLRSFPYNPISVAKIFRNIVIIRTIDGLMRKKIGQKWNDFNERRALRRSNGNLKKSHS